MKKFGAELKMENLACFVPPGGPWGHQPMSAFNASVSYLMVSHSPNEKRGNCFARYDNKQLRRDRVGTMILAMEGSTMAFSRTFQTSKC